MLNSLAKLLFDMEMLLLLATRPQRAPFTEL